jgi:hypothetical protein
MADYSTDAADALASIKEAGKEYDISRKVLVFDDVTGLPVDDERISGKIAAIILPRYKGPIFQNLDASMKEALIQGKMKTVLAAAQGAPFAPEALDEISLNGTVWDVVGCTELAPDGLPIIYTIGVILK